MAPLGIAYNAIKIILTVSIYFACETRFGIHWFFTSSTIDEESFTFLGLFMLLHRFTSSGSFNQVDLTTMLCCPK